MRSEPYVCPQCLKDGSYTGSLRHGDQAPPNCKNHGKNQEQWVEMKPVKEVKRG